MYSNKFKKDYKKAVNLCDLCGFKKITAEYAELKY
jgi:hypothetical protein